jgi:hypothetical protein
MARDRMTRALLVAAATLVAAPLAHADGEADFEPVVAGLGPAGTSDATGARERVTGIAPAARRRVGEDRLADVRDALPSIALGDEGGVFGGYHYVDPRSLPWELRAGVSVRTAVAGDVAAGRFTPCASVWMPLGRMVFVGFGAGFTWAGEGSPQQRLGAGPSVVAPSGLPANAPGTGLRQIHAGPALIVRLGPDWFAAGGAFYQHSTAAAAAGPLGASRGDHGTWSVGAGLGRTWR